MSAALGKSSEAIDTRRSQSRRLDCKSHHRIKEKNLGKGQMAKNTTSDGARVVGCIAPDFAPDKRDGVSAPTVGLERGKRQDALRGAQVWAGC